MKAFTALYRQLFEAVYSAPVRKFKETELSNFVAMRGCRYNEKLERNDAIRFMVVGRAVNGWGKSMPVTSANAYAEKAAELFTQTDRYKQEWNMNDGCTAPYSEYTVLNDDGSAVLNTEGKPLVKKYHLNNSAFWHTAIEIYKELSKDEPHPQTDWYEDIVWNNLYKVAPLKSGNPSTNLIYTQAETCVKLLREEIRLLKPTHMLLVIDQSWLSWAPRKRVMFDFKEALGEPVEIHATAADPDKKNRSMRLCRRRLQDSCHLPSGNRYTRNIHPGRS